MEQNTEGVILNPSVPNKRVIQTKYWVFTWNNYPEDAETILKNALEKRSTKFTFQSEIGEKGTPHIQGCIELIKKGRPTELKLPNTIHWEPMKGKWAQAEAYCTKEDTHDKHIRVTSPYDERDVIKTLEETQLYPWQTYIENIYHTEPDDRIIYWFWEPNGCAGKTAFTKYMCIKYPNKVCFSTATKSADILTIAEPMYKMYILNFTRSQEGFAPWSALEQLKDGLISDSKLKKKSRQIIMNSPHVICFANWEPISGQLSKDRLKIEEIKE